ncbi:MAG TPA: hypothetical protein PK040_04950 [Anaerolineaceae bacterium]|nr:hypothetical protein [Anaerolineaceae bacterium]
MNVNQIEYQGWKRCIELSNKTIRLVVTAEVGPRIIFCGFTGGGNLFYENPQQMGEIGGEEWKTYGGHRFWVSPETWELTYAPDNSPVEVQTTGDCVRFIPPREKSRLQKLIEVSIAGETNNVRVTHILENNGSDSLTLAPWALSVMHANSLAILPHNLEHSVELLPTHAFALWKYTDMSDPRWTWGRDYILLHQDPAKSSPQKAGLINRYGWAASQLGNQVFIKRFPYEPDAAYPDFGCNFEVYTNGDILELESLGPLQELRPGRQLTHTELWSLHKDIPPVVDDTSISKFILPLVSS